MPEYNLVRAKRKTLAITIRDGEVIVKAPLKMSLDHINSFVAEKENWINKKLAEFERKDEIFAPVIDGDAVMVGGRMYPIVKTDACKKIRLDDTALLLPIKYDGEAATRAIASWYKRTASAYLSIKLDEYARATGLKYASFATTNARTKWGSCDGKCNIRLNWRLIMLDDKLVEYVIIHELSHTIHHNHSAAFWAEVGKHFQNYKAARKGLKVHSVLTSLYR